MDNTKEKSAKRRLDKKINSVSHDANGAVGDTSAYNKAQRAYSKVIIEDALDNNADNDSIINKEDRCIMCNAECESLCCSPKCADEAKKLGLFNGVILDAGKQ